MIKKEIGTTFWDTQKGMQALYYGTEGVEVITQNKSVTTKLELSKIKKS